MDEVARFAAEAGEFRDWATHGTDQGAAAVRNALVRVTGLYLAGLALPPAWSDELEIARDAEPVGQGELRTVREGLRRLPFQYYGDVFDPLPVPPEDSVIGDVMDDIEDIYSDVIRGLQAYEAGRRAQAVWEWVFGLQHHWGKHATSAIRALHCWLAENDADRLASEN